MIVLRFVVVLSLCVGKLRGCAAPEPIVEIEGGKILGRDRGHYFSFESIPYAEPPVGERRFEAPQAFAKNWTGVRDATSPPVNCMQWDQYLFRDDLLDGEEDCLTVNVYTPSITGSRNYPVLALIHGGAFMFGSAAANGEEYVMEYKNTVVVKMNYRLGPLGFLSTEDEVIAGNFGLKDQRLALEWTKKNVAAFGGNPANITILGFSSGGAAVHLQMLNKDLEAIARSAISFSGTAFCPWVISRNPLKRATALAAHLNCPTESSSVMKSCLQQKDAAQIVRAVSIFQKFGYNPFTVFGPVVESKAVPNAFLSEEPESIMRSGMSADIPWLVSYSKDDGGYNAAELLQKDANGVELIEVLNERWTEIAPVNLFFEGLNETSKLVAHSNDLLAKYMGGKRFCLENYRQLQQMYTDVLFVEGVEKAVNLRKMYTKSPTFLYVYDNPAAHGIGQTLSHRDDVEFGTVHGDDFFLMFCKGLELKAGNEQKMSRNFIKMLHEFSARGNLQFGDCKFVDNNSTTRGFMLMHITKDSCDVVNDERLTQGN